MEIKQSRPTLRGITEEMTDRVCRTLSVRSRGKNVGLAETDTHAHTHTHLHLHSSARAVRWREREVYRLNRFAHLVLQRQLIIHRKTGSAANCLFFLFFWLPHARVGVGVSLTSRWGTCVFIFPLHLSLSIPFSLSLSLSLFLFVLRATTSSVDANEEQKPLPRMC